MPREKIVIETETLQYISLNEDNGNYELTLQFSGGGVLAKIKRADSSQEVIKKLSYLIYLIEKSVINRSAQ